MRDEWFIRGSIPMTKSEVRAVSLSKLEVKEDSVVYDIGAGTGSVSVEAAFLASAGHVYALEQKEEARELIRKNSERFHTKNLTIVAGSAPESMEVLPAPDCAFLGGSSGAAREILGKLLEKNPSVRIVANVIALESLSQVLEAVKEYGLTADIVCVQISKASQAGDYHMMLGQNPVYVITAEKSTSEEQL